MAIDVLAIAVPHFQKPKSVLDYFGQLSKIMFSEILPKVQSSGLLHAIDWRRYDADAVDYRFYFLDRDEFRHDASVKSGRVWLYLKATKPGCYSLIRYSF